MMIAQKTQHSAGLLRAFCAIAAACKKPGSGHALLQDARILQQGMT
ncbi:MAG TPA: hypothetical protein VJ752_09715 [Burkholderiaceae bacterium]|nr:hypothetical protein [Burkholderiaceae bacterium]